MQELETEYREVPHGQLYLERVEAAAMGVLVRAVNDMNFDAADRCIELMERLAIV